MASASAPKLRLRQICLVAAKLARETELVKAIFWLEECYRDANVARARVLAAANARGCVVSNGTVAVCGVRFRLTQEA